MMRIPQFVMRRVEHASPAETALRRTTFYQHSKGSTFANPLPAAARIAVLARLFEERNGVKYFDPEDVAAIQAFRPQIVAGTVHSLLKLPAQIAGLRALVVFSGARVGQVSSRDRDLLWRGFQLPLFEQRLASNGTVVARECEAHDGLHLVANVFANIAGECALLPGPCECGRLEARIAFGS